MSVILPAEGHAFAIEIQQAVIADGNPVCVPAQIPKYLSRAAKCRSDIHDPILPKDRTKESREALRVVEAVDRTVKPEFPAPVKPA